MKIYPASDQKKHSIAERCKDNKKLSQDEMEDMIRFLVEKAT